MKKPLSTEWVLRFSSSCFQLLADVVGLIFGDIKSQNNKNSNDQGYDGNTDITKSHIQ